MEGEDKLDISAIKGAEELVLDIVKDKISKIPKPKITGGFRDTSSSSGVAESFETVSKNLDSSGATLTYTVALVKELARVPITTLGVAAERDLVNQLPSLPRIYDGAALYWMIGSSTTTPANATFSGHILTAWN